MIELLGIKLIYPNVVTTVVLTAVLLSIISIVIHRKMVDPKKAKEIKEKVDDYQRRYLEAQKSGDEKKLKKLELEQEEIMTLVKQNMYNSMKPLFITTPIVLLVIWAFGSMFGSLGAVIELPWGLPIITRAFPDQGIVNGIDWLGLYMVTAILASIILQIILKLATGREKK